ncbi:unnamed protein product, partial [Rotaria sp. Silwood1]
MISKKFSTNPESFNEFGRGRRIDLARSGGMTHKLFLERTEKNCPKHLTDPQRSRWFKTAKKAKRNAQIVQQLPAFHWPPSHSN